MKAHELLNSPKRWTKLVPARDANCRPVSVDSEEACRWCLLGAIERCYPEEEKYLTARIAISKAIGSTFISVYNDSAARTFEEVHGLLVKLDL